MPDKTMNIDKKSPIPVYHQIVADLNERIDGGEWNVGDKLPSEDILSTEYGVSRITLRQALSVLEDEGFITRMRGKGSYLTERAKPFVEDLNFPILQKYQRTQHQSTCKILEIRTDDNPPLYIKQLFSSQMKDMQYSYICRLFLRKGRVLGLNRVWFPTSLVPGITKEGLINDSITTTLSQRYHYKFSKIDNYIEASIVSAADAVLLNCQCNSSVLKIQSTYFLNEDSIIEYSNTLWLGRLTRFHLKLEE